MLLLDEATSALDAESERLVNAALETLMKDRTSVVIAHRLSTIQGADCVCVLADGVLAEQGKHGDLVALGGVYAALISRQLAGGSGNGNGADDSVASIVATSEDEPSSSAATL